METKIKLQSTSKFRIANEEKMRLYTALALLQYQFDCKPDYNEISLRRRLCNDFQRFNFELSLAHEKDPNNLRLSQVRNFVQHHYGNIKQIVNQENAEEKITIKATEI